MPSAIEAWNFNDFRLFSLTKTGYTCLTGKRYRAIPVEAFGSIHDFIAVVQIHTLHDDLIANDIVIAQHTDLRYPHAALEQEHHRQWQKLVLIKKFGDDIVIDGSELLAGNEYLMVLSKTN